MAKIIEFYVPSSFQKKASKWTPPEELGKVIPFSLPEKKSAWDSKLPEWLRLGALRAER